MMRISIIKQKKYQIITKLWLHTPALKMILFLWSMSLVLKLKIFSKFTDIYPSLSHLTRKLMISLLNSHLIFRILGYQELTRRTCLIRTTWTTQVYKRPYSLLTRLISSLSTTSATSRSLLKLIQQIVYRETMCICATNNTQCNTILLTLVKDHYIC